MDFFDHGIADFPLEGKHTEVACKACHTKNYSSPIDFSACKNCHTDYHRGEFDKKDINPDCNECHSLQQGFEYSLYDIDRHNKTDFILKGAHLATPCFSCHKTDKQWKFKSLGKSCNTCHSDIHQKQINPEYYPDQDCTACHEERSWETIHFDHNLTQWPLEGQHNNVKCAACHFEDPLSGKIVKQRFKDLKTNCISCHKNVHEDQFAINGTTDCKRCHNPKDWFPYKFDHNKTAFPLEGRHAEIACKACHPVTVTEGEKHITYKIGKFECIDCHK